MTKLEEEILAAIESNASEDFITDAKAAAEVAKKYIENAWINGSLIPDRFCPDKFERMDKYLKENGIIG